MKSLAVAVSCIAALLMTACTRTSQTATGADSTAKSNSTAATPVQMARVTRATLDVVVRGPGKTDALNDERIRAPFKGTLFSLGVNVGDHVARGQVVASIVSQTSVSELEGARAMLAAATTPSQRADAQRAVTLAEHNMVHLALRSPVSGVVLARAASPGEIAAEGDSLISIAATGSMVFFADIAQSDLGAVHTGDRSVIVLTGRSAPIDGRVHAIIPADTGATVNMRVRIDLQISGPQPNVGLFGTANIIVGEHANAVVVPKAALFRDDVSGKTRIAIVGADNRAHWVDVTPGIADSTRVEIIAPDLATGQRVITSGQVGLPDSTRVVESAGNGAAGGGGTGSGPGASTTSTATSGAAGTATSTGANPTPGRANAAPSASPPSATQAPSSPSPASPTNQQRSPSTSPAASASPGTTPSTTAPRTKPAPHAPTPGARGTPTGHAPASGVASLR